MPIAQCPPGKNINVFKIKSIQLYYYIISKVCNEQRQLEQLEGEDLLDQSEGDSEEDDKIVVSETSDLEDDSTGGGGTDKPVLVEVPPPSSKVLSKDMHILIANTTTVGSSAVAAAGLEVRGVAGLDGSAFPNTMLVGGGGEGAGLVLRSTPNTVKVVTRAVDTTFTVQQHALARDGMYLAINMYRRAASSAINLLGGAPCITPPEGSIFNGKMSRVDHCFTIFRFGEKFNIMSRFCLNLMKCECCKESSKVLEKRVACRHAKRRTLVLSDQHFPATLPASGGAYSA